MATAASDARPTSMGRSENYAKNKRRKSAKSATAPDPILRAFRALGLGSKASNGLLGWNHARHFDFTQTQLAERMDCHQTTASDALVILIREGLADLVEAHQVGGPDAGAKRGRYKFTPRFFAIRGQGKTFSPGGNENIKNQNCNSQHSSKQPRSARPSGLPAVPCVYLEIYQDLKSRAEAIQDAAPFREAALRHVIATSTVDPAHLLDLLDEAVRDGAIRTDVAHPRSRALAALKPGNSAWAADLLAERRRRLEAEHTEPASQPEPKTDPADVAALIAAGVTPEQAPAVVAGIPAEVAGVERTYLIAAALAHLRTRERQTKINNPGGFLRGVLRTASRDQSLLRQARALQEEAIRAKHATSGTTWEGVREPMRSDPTAQALFAAHKRLQAAVPAPDAPGFLDAFDAKREAFRDLVADAEARLGAGAEPLRLALASRLAEGKLQEGTLIWRRAWDHHWSRVVCETWGIQI